MLNERHSHIVKSGNPKPPFPIRLIGMIQTFAVAIDYSLNDLFVAIGLPPDKTGALSDLYSATVAQIGPILPYLLLVLMLIFRPTGLLGKREV